MNYGYEIAKEILETAIYSAMCFGILGLQRKGNKFFWRTMIVVHILVWGVIVLFTGNETVVLFACMFLEIGLPIVVSKGTPIKRIATVFCSYTVMGLAFDFMRLILRFVFEINLHIHNLIPILTSSVLIAILCIIKAAYKKPLIDIYRIHSAILFALGLFCIGVSAFISNVLNHDFKSVSAAAINMIAITILILSFVLCFFILLMMNKKEMEMEQANTANAAIIESQKEYCQEILNDREEIKSIYHDLNQLVFTLNSLFESRRYDDAVQIVGKLNQKLNGKQHTLTYTHNEFVDAIISQYIGIAQNHNIKFSVQIQIDKPVQLQECDFGIILSNLLSNALEAAGHAEDNKIVKLSIKQHQNQLYISVENTFHAKNSNVQFHYSTKSGNNHGYGVKNVRKAVARLGGEVHFQTEGHYVMAEVLLPQI